MFDRLKEYAAAIWRRPLLKNLIVIAGLVLVMAVAAHLLLLAGTRHKAHRTVPDLTGIPLEEALAAVGREGLEIVVNDSLYVPAYEGGIVLDQLPEKGVGVKPGRTVYVTINSFRQKTVEVPYVAGRSLRQAKNMLEVAGLGIEKIVYEPDMATNYVLGEYVGDRKISADSRVQAEVGSGVTLHVGESGRVTALVPKVVGQHLQQARSRLWEQGLNVGKVTSDPEINLLNQKEARVYLQTPAAGSRVRLGTRIDLRLTLDGAKAMKQSAEADKVMAAAAEELRRAEAAAADSLARVRLDSLSAAQSVSAPELGDDGLFTDEEVRFSDDDEFFQ